MKPLSFEFECQPCGELITGLILYKENPERPLVTVRCPQCGMSLVGENETSHTQKVLDMLTAFYKSDAK